MPTNHDFETWARNRSLYAVGKQHCNKCGNDLDLAEFNPSDRGNCGTYCTTCKRAANLARYQAKGAALAPDKHRARAYGVKAAEYKAMIAGQLGRCAICGTSLADLAPKLVHLDHDHETGAARGVLCFRCNVLVGAARDSTAILQAIIAYLSR